MYFYELPKKSSYRYPGFGIVVSRRLQGVSREYKGDITQNIPGVALKFLIWEWGGINEGWHKVFKNGGGIKGGGIRFSGVA